MQNKYLFSLDIGTRSVIGIVAEQTENTIKILATDRREHNTRAMLDGQIHDVPEVALVIKDIKASLEEKTGRLTHAAVAAAGRALYTVTAEAEIEVSAVMTGDDERMLDFAGIQAAQKKLATSNTVDDPTLYYCVGYSTIKYTLDGTQLKTLVGQRGKIAAATVIATFLPRQVIDSMQSALREADLEMSALTLEPIAAINVLIPPTMRHLNLALVDIGAGTSDVAITKDGSVIAYGMVPLAGDEITEAISQKYLLDFNVAEKIKRQLSAAKQKKIVFQDILGMEYRLSPKEITDAILPNVMELGQSIASQILQLNVTPPQAVLLVGGGALTPSLPEVLAQALDIPAPRVAVRTPETVLGISTIPQCLKTSDSVTPLGILKAASANILNLITVKINRTDTRMFNLSNLTVSDALLAAGINMKSLGGKPGLGITLTINNETKFMPGTMGKIAKLTLNGKPAALKDTIKDGDAIIAEPGADGKIPSIYLKDVVPKLPQRSVIINKEEFSLESTVLVNQKPGDPSQQLKDRDIISWHELKNLGEILVKANYTPTPRRYKYKLNNTNSQCSASPEIFINGSPATVSAVVKDGDQITFVEPKPPKIADIIGTANLETSKPLTIYFNKNKCTIPTAESEILMDGQPATLDTKIKNGSEIIYKLTEKRMAMVSDVLLAAEFQPPSALSQVKFEILVNQKHAEFTTPVKNGDAIDIIITPLKP